MSTTAAPMPHSAVRIVPMDEIVRQELLAKTRQALDAAEDWAAIERLWLPWAEQGDADAQFQLAYHYLWCTAADDEEACYRMKKLRESAAAKGHADAIWFLASSVLDRDLKDAEAQREILRAAELGSIHAQRAIGVMYAWGEWSGSIDLTQAARWYRAAAEKGDAASQYDLGFMLLLGEGAPKSTEEGLIWLERAGEQGEASALRLLADCYEHGYYDVSADRVKADEWRGRLQEYERHHPSRPARRYSIEGTISESALSSLLGVTGVTGYGLCSGANELCVSYEPAVITPAGLDETIRTRIPSAKPVE